MTKKATAAIMHKPDDSFSFEEIELDDLRSDEILVRIEASGVCHTDMIAQDMTPLPAVLLAMNSFAIRFIPSLKGVTSATSAALYSAVSLLKGMKR